MPAQQDRGRVNTLLLGNLDDGLCCQQRATCAAERAVCGDVNALLLAEVNSLLLGQAGVVLNLVDGWNHGGLGEELLKVGPAVVADTDGLGLSATDKLLHILPGVDMGVVEVQVAGTVREGGDVGVVSFAMSICASH